MQVSLKSDKNNSGTLHEDVRTFTTKPRSFLLIMRKMFQTKIVENTKHILFPKTFFPKSYHFWDNVEKYGRPRQTTGNNAVRSRRFAC